MEKFCHNWYSWSYSILHHNQLARPHIGQIM